MLYTIMCLDNLLCLNVIVWSLMSLWIRNYIIIKIYTHLASQCFITALATDSRVMGSSFSKPVWYVLKQDNKFPQSTTEKINEEWQKMLHLINLVIKFYPSHRGVLYSQWHHALNWPDETRPRMRLAPGQGRL